MGCEGRRNKMGVGPRVSALREKAQRYGSRRLARKAQEHTDAWGRTRGTGGSWAEK